MSAIQKHQASSITTEQADLLKRTLAKGTTDDEFSLFVNVANRLGLDPFAKQIYAVMRYDKDAGRKVMTIQTSIDGYRSVADRTGETDGQEGPFWCGTDGVWRETWLDSFAPLAAKVVVYRKGVARGFPGVAHLSEYEQTTREGKPSGQWRTMPALMLAKCAEALALRKAFPSQLAGVYTSDEMHQADGDGPPETAAEKITAVALPSERADIAGDIVRALQESANQAQLDEVKAAARTRYKQLDGNDQLRVKLAIEVASERISAQQVVVDYDPSTGEVSPEEEAKMDEVKS